MLSLDLAKAMCQLSLEIRRPLALLLTRRGQVQEIIIGTDLALSPTTLSKFRAGSRSLRGLRLIRTQLQDQPLSQESLNDLAYLRLDLFGVLSVTPSANPGTLYQAHLLRRTAQVNSATYSKAHRFNTAHWPSTASSKTSKSTCSRRLEPTRSDTKESRPCWSALPRGAAASRRSGSSN